MIMKAVQQFQLGTVMNNEAQTLETLRRMKEAGYDAIELCGFMIRPSGLAVKLLTKAAGMPVGSGGRLDWKRLVSESGLKVCAIHEDLGGMEKNTDAIIKEASDFGTEYIVLTGMYRFAYNDHDAVSGLCGRMNAVGKTFAENGVKLLYHNHNVEFLRTAGGERAYDILQQKLDPEYVNFEFDSYWATDAGANVPEIMRGLGPRMKLWHINDRGTRQVGPAMTPILKSDSMELGCGNMDLDTLSGIAKENRIDAVILESHRNWAEKSPIRSFEISAEYLNSRF